MLRSLLPLCLAVLVCTPAHALDPPKRPDSVWADYRRPVGFEVNVLWPFFPGGLVDLKVMVPVLRRDRLQFRGELVLGLHSDFGWRNVRETDAGKVAILALKLGYRQFFVYGLHLDVTINAGWRHEEGNPFDGTDLDGFVGRLWLMGGYQHEFTRRIYANLRAGVGISVWRTDRFGDRERLLAPAADLNLGVRF